LGRRRKGKGEKRRDNFLFRIFQGDAKLLSHPEIKVFRSMKGKKMADVVFTVLSGRKRGED